MTNEIALQNVLTPSAVDPALDGFEFASPDDYPFITLDANRRFYFNAALRKMFRLSAYSKVAIAYRADTQEIAIFTGGHLEVPANHAFILDKRHYTSARKFVEHHGINLDSLPLRYVYSRGTSKDGVYVFKQVGSVAKPKPIRKDVSPKVETKAEADLFTPAIASVTLLDEDRLQFEGLTSTSVFVAHNTKTLNIEVSYEDIPNGKRVNVGNDGVSDSLRQFSGMYAGKRPVVYAYDGVTPSGVLAFRKVKA